MYARAINDAPSAGILGCAVLLSPPAGVAALSLAFMQGSDTL
jgi:hypothetical protein